MGYVTLNKKTEYEQTPTEHATADVLHHCNNTRAYSMECKFTRYILRNPLSVLVRPEPHNHR
jgi:hypothetical protein